MLDGEIVSVDGRGHPQFYDLLYRRHQPYFFAFDLLLANQDIRYSPLAKGKAALRSLLRAAAGPLLTVDHIDRQGEALIERVCGHN